MSQLSFAAIILAAGSGTRMKSALPKVMHPIAGRPMIAYPLEALRPLSPAATVVVIGPRMERVAAIVAPAESVVQDQPLGTGDAVRTAMRALDSRLAPRGSIEDVLVLYGGGRAGLANKLFNAIGGLAGILRQDFEGDVAIEATVFGTYDHAHAAAAQHAE